MAWPALGGEIGVESVEGRGSTFTLSIPYKPVETVAQGPVETSVDPLPGLRILLVEDSLINQVYMAHLLRREGHDAILAADGASALASLAREHFDVVLMDIQMPDMDGTEVLRRIRAGNPILNPRVPVVALTAYALTEDRERFLGLGMDGYVSKPVILEELRAELRRVLKLS